MHYTLLCNDALAFIAPTTSRVNIAIALAPFLVIHRRQVTIVPFLAVELPSRRSAVPSITVNSPSRRPSPPIAVVLSVQPPPRSRRPPLPSRSRHTPPLAVKEPSHRPSPSRSHSAVPRRRGAVASSIAVKEPSRHTLPSRSCRPCRLTTPATRLAPPSLSSGWLSRCLSSHCHLPSDGAFHASRPSGWLSCLLPSHADTSHLPAPLPLMAPSPLVTPILGLSSSWLRRHLSPPCRHHLSAG